MHPSPGEPATQGFDIEEILDRRWLYADEFTKIAGEIRLWDEDNVLELLRALLMQSGPLGVDAERYRQIDRYPDLPTGPAREYWRSPRLWTARSDTPAGPTRPGLCGGPTAGSHAPNAAPASSAQPP